MERGGRINLGKNEINYEIYANGENIKVYQDETRSYDIKNFDGEIYKTVTDRPAYAIISNEFPISFEIVSKKVFDKIKMRPISANIVPNISEGIIKFVVDTPQKLSLEFDDDLSEPLLLFINKTCINVPDLEAEGIHFFKGGKSYDIGCLELKSNETLYIEKGAVVYGTIKINQAENVRICGGGVLDGTKLHRNETRQVNRLILANSCKNLTIEGITLFDGPTWHLVVVNSNFVKIDNVNIISLVPSGDGIDLVGSSNVEISRCLFKTNDDCVAVKCFPKGENEYTIIKDIVVHDCVCWSATHGNVLEIGYELCTDEVKNITFRDCDIIHCEHEGYQSGGVFTIHNGDHACVNNILYENIRVEDANEKLIDIKVLNAVYSTDKIRGKVQNIRFKNIQVVDGTLPPSIIRGYESEESVFRVEVSKDKIMYVIRDLRGQGCVEDIVIDGLYVHGNKIENLQQGKIVVEISTNVRFE